MNSAARASIGTDLDALFGSAPRRIDAPPTNIYSLAVKYLEYIHKVEGLAVSTVDNRRAALKSFTDFCSKSVEDITLIDIDNYCIARREDVKASTLNIEKQTLRGFFGWCQVHRLIPLQFDYTMIKRSREKPPKVKTFDHELISSVIKQCKQPTEALMIAVLFETGIRIGELVELKVDDIRDTEVHVRGKGEKDRVVLMTAGLSLALRAYLIERRISRGYVFQPFQHHSNHQNVKYTVAGARDAVKRAFRNCGIKMHPHQLRHSFAICWLRSGGDIRTLSHILGHASVETTMRYLQITDNHLQQEYRRHFSTSVIKSIT